MNITIIGRKCTPRESFKERAELKLKKLDKFFDDAKAQVTVSTQKNQATVELTVWANNLIFRSEAKNEDKLEALDEALENLIRRIRKNKTKLQKKVKASGFEIPAEEIPEEEYEVIRTKEVPLRPMSVEEAILQMNLLDHSFYVFRNSDDDSISIVYQRKNGGYGLIVTDEEE